MNAALPALSPNSWLRWDVVSRMLPPGKLDVLEVGAGQGGLGARLARRHRYVGVEPDPVSAAVASTRVEPAGGEVRQGDLRTVAADELFDLVCAFEVIEHIEDDVAAVHEWSAHLRPGGWLLLSTPAWAHRFGPADELVGHFRRYDPPVLRDLLTNSRLVDVEVVHFGAPLGYLLEAARNRVGRRRLGSATEESQAERTAASGRTLQSSAAWSATAAMLGTAPFRLLQRAFPGTGPGLIARGRTPTD